MRECLNGLSRWIEYDLRNDLFRHLETLQASFYHRTPTGDITARATNDLGAVRMVAGPAIMYLTDTVTRALIAVPLMARIDWRLTAVGLLPLTAMPAVMIALGKRIHQRFEAVQEHFGILTTRAHENLSGVRVVRAYRQEEPEILRFAALSQEYVRRNLRLARTFGALFPLVTFLGGAGGVLMLWFGSLLVIRGAVTLGDFVAMTTYLLILVWPMMALGWVVNLFERGAASMGRIQELLAEVPTVADPAAPLPLPAASGGRTIELRGVWFRYPTPKLDGDGRSPSRGWALEDVSFVAEAGAWVAIVGATGAGKTTAVELIPRLADPDHGEILLDGVPLRSLTLTDLRRTIGFVPRETFLFSRTIGENIALGGDEPATLEDAARVAQLHETVSAFPSGYDTTLGERGINLSGGQKQRTALARALARNPSVIVLDDALSAVDSETEAEILRGLKRAATGRTTIVVSHRITAIRDADLIVVLEAGRVVERGRHEELFERRGTYWRLLKKQQMEEALEAVG